LLGTTTLRSGVSRLQPSPATSRGQSFGRAVGVAVQRGSCSDLDVPRRGPRGRRDDRSPRARSRRPVPVDLGSITFRATCHTSGGTHRRALRPMSGRKRSAPTTTPNAEFKPPSARVDVADPPRQPAAFARHPAAVPCVRKARLGAWRREQPRTSASVHALAPRTAL
jgi:hypothetical protein